MHVSRCFAAAAVVTLSLLPCCCYVTTSLSLCREICLVVVVYITLPILLSLTMQLDCLFVEKFALLQLLCTQRYQFSYLSHYIRILSLCREICLVVVYITLPILLSLTMQLDCLFVETFALLLLCSLRLPILLSLTIQLYCLFVQKFALLLLLCT